MINKYKTKIAAYLLSAGVLFSGCAKEDDIILTFHDNDSSDSTSVIEEVSQTENTSDNNYVIDEVVFQTQEPEETEPLIVDVDEINCDYPVYYVKEDTVLKTSDGVGAFDIDLLPAGVSVYGILNLDNGFSLINYNGSVGYVNNDNLELTNEVVSLDYNYKVKKDIALTTTNLNFRCLPNTDSNIMTTFTPGVELQVLAEVSNGWLLVRNSGKIGYVSKEYTISLLDTLKLYYPSIDLNELDVKNVVYVRTGLNFRTQPNTECEIIKQFDTYESLRVIDDCGDWYLVMTNEYEFGYVHKDYVIDLNEDYVIVDLSTQRLYMYNDDELLFTTPVTTGKDSTPSDIGLFSIYAKERDRYLVGADYRAFVNYWMPYNGGEGLHDASWRSEFGTDTYRYGGSHGCINMPGDKAAMAYENSRVGTKVLVHK